MGQNNIFRLQFHLEKDQIRLILSDGEKELNQRNLPADILKFMAAAQMQLDSLFENHIPLNREQQRDWGEILSRTLFGDEEFLKPMIEEIRDSDDDDFRLVIQSDLAEALQFPWEFCYLKNLDFLGASRRLVPVRMPIETRLTRKAEIKGEPLRVLVYVCAPDDLPEDKALEYEREQEFILEIFDQLESRGVVDLQTPAEGDLASLERYLTDFKPHVLHLSGHAIYEKGELADQKGGFFLFETPEGATQPIATADLNHIFLESHKPHLVVLSACQTAQGFLPDLPGIAQSLLHAGIPHVVGMNHSVPDLKATDWAQAFYQSLVTGDSIHGAVGGARRKLYQDEKVKDASWGIPVLFSRDTFTRLTAESLRPALAPMTPMDEQENVNDVLHLRKGFIGRRREQRELLRTLRQGDKNAVIITGQGGEGKSVLAIRLAKILADDDQYGLLVYKTSEYEELFLEPLEPVIAASPELTELRRKYTDAELLPILVQQVLPHQRMVLLLDNFETLLDEHNRFRSDKTRTLIQSLLTIKNGPFRLLITSRREWVDLNLPENVLVYPLPSLSRAETIKKINRYQPINALNFEQKKEIHGKLGGSPKAVELLNGYFSGKPDVTWGKVKGRLPAIQSEMLGFITYDLCYNSLSPEAQVLIRRASLLDRPFLKDAFYYLVPELSQEIRQLIPQLLRVSLLQKLTDPRYAFADGRTVETFAVHPIVAEPLQKLLTEQELLAALRQIGSYLERQGLEISGNPLDLEAACEYYWKGKMPQGAEALLDTNLQPFWERTGQYSKMLAFADRLIQFSSSNKSKADAYYWKATGLTYQGNYSEAHDLFNEMLKIKNEIGDRTGISLAYHQMASIKMNQGHYEEALKLFNEALKLRKEIDFKGGMASTLHQMATVQMRQGNYTEALRLFDQVLKQRKDIGDRAGMATTLHQMASVQVHQGNYAEALRLFDQTLKLEKDIGDRAGMAGTLHQMATVQMNQGNYAEALRLFDQTLKQFKDIGDRAGMATTLHQMATVQMRQGNYAEALRLFDQSMKIKKDIGDRAGMAHTMHQIGSVKLQQQDFSTAFKIFQDALRIEIGVGDQEFTARTMFQMGWCYYGRKLFEKAFEFVVSSFFIANSIGMGDAKIIMENLNAFANQLPEKTAKKITENVQMKLQQGQLPEIVPLE